MIVTHYHADHTNGLTEVLTRLPVDTLYLPDIEDEYGVRDRLVSLAAHQGADVVFVTEPTRIALGEAVLTVYPPLGEDGSNERGLVFLCSAGDYDLLITGDINAETEQILLERCSLPQREKTEPAGQSAARHVPARQAAQPGAVFRPMPAKPVQTACHYRTAYQAFHLIGEAG